MPDNPPDNTNNLLEFLKKLWLPITGFIGAVTSVYNFYQLWLGDQGTVTCFFAGGGLLVLVITLVWVGFSKKTITLKPDKPIGPSRKERVPRYPLWLRIVAWISIIWS
jgi:hypothetical protein